MLIVVLIVFGILWYVASSVNKAFGGPPTGGPIALFNGRDLTNFYSYLGPPTKGEKPLGRNHDPKKVFTVVDGAIRSSGEVYGYLATEREYENYHLTVEYKWGDKTWPPREHNARDGGVLLHGTGADKVWMESIEFQMIEGGTGDIILVKGQRQPTVTAAVEQRGKATVYTPGAPPREVKAGRIDWFARDPAWQDVKGFRGPHDIERPVGQWNVLECACDGASLTYKLNGVVVNAVTHSSHTKGKILLQSEGAEVFFRKVELRPLGK
jgi:hypothetical protein